MKTVLAWSCDHPPYHHVDALDFLTRLKKKWKPDTVVHLGDEADLHRLSRHEHEIDALSLPEELTRVRQYHSDLADIFPRLYLCHSNHVARLHTAATRGGLLPELVKDWSEIIKAPKSWKWDDTWVFGGVTYFHGDGYGGQNAIRNAIDDFATNVVFGHLHTETAIRYFRTRNWHRWGVCTGALHDPTKQCPAFRYAKHNRKKPILGAVVVAGGVPYYEPLKV